MGIFTLEQLSDNIWAEGIVSIGISGIRVTLELASESRTMLFDIERQDKKSVYLSNAGLVRRLLSLPSTPNSFLGLEEGLAIIKKLLDFPLLSIKGVQELNYTGKATGINCMPLNKEDILNYIGYCLKN